MAIENQISALIIKNSEQLIKQSVPSIAQIVEKTGIKNIGRPNMEMPGSCVSQEELQNILELRNNILGKLNSVSNKIKLLIKPLNILSTSANALQLSIDILKDVRKIVSSNRNIVSNTITPPIPSPPGTPGLLVSTLSNLSNTDFKSKEIIDDILKPRLGQFQNKISSISEALDYANSILFKLLNILKSVDQYLAGCNVILPDTLKPNDYINQVNQQYENTQLNPNLDPNVSRSSEIYNGFTLEIIEEPFSSTANRRKAVAKNSQGIILLQTPLTFSTENQVLIAEIKLIIDSNNLKAN
jgi:conjugal transfer/entry exclusion protein